MEQRHVEGQPRLVNCGGHRAFGFRQPVATPHVNEVERRGPERFEKHRTEPAREHPVSAPTWGRRRRVHPCDDRGAAGHGGARGLERPAAPRHRPAAAPTWAPRRSRCDQRPRRPRARGAPRRAATTEAHAPTATVSRTPALVSSARARRWGARPKIHTDRELPVLGQRKHEVDRSSSHRSSIVMLSSNTPRTRGTSKTQTSRSSRVAMAARGQRESARRRPGCRVDQ